MWCWKRSCLSAHHFLIFSQDEVIVTERHAEDDGGHSLKTVDPFLPLGSLAAHIKHSESTGYVGDETHSWRVTLKAMIFTRNYGKYWFNPCMILIRQTYPTKTMIKIVHKQMTQLKAGTWIMHTSNSHTLRYCVSHKNGFNGLTVDDKTHLKWRSLKVKWVSTIPVVFTLVLRTSCWVGI